jgi:hypothetical protein
VEREYDLFEQMPDGSPMWRGHASGLLEVRRKLTELSKGTLNECFAMHLPTKEVVARINVRTAKGTKPVVFQITYNSNLGGARAEFFRLHGYEVISAIGNEAARVLLTIPQQFDLFVVGDGAPQEARREMVSWLKANYPNLRILAVNSPAVGALPGADYNARLNGPESLLPLMAAALGH